MKIYLLLGQMKEQEAMDRWTKKYHWKYDKNRRLPKKSLSTNVSFSEESQVLKLSSEQ